MPKRTVAATVVNKFKTEDPRRRKAAFTAQVARWINGMEQAKAGCRAGREAGR